MACYLGLDAGTQSLKALIIDENGILAEAAVHFGRDLPQFESPNGFLPNPDDAIRHANPAMWHEALDLVLQRLADQNAPLSQVKGISGSGQQHGSVYRDAQGRLSRPTAPIWMDHATSTECQELFAAFGSRVQTDTGSCPIERFTGPQIRRFAKLAPAAYAQTAHIHLVSSDLCSALIDATAPIDYGDGAGMNLLNLKTLQWDPEIAEFTAPGLLQKLPPAVPSYTIAGPLATRFVRYGLRPGTPVVVWSGDNPNSLIGTGAATPGTAVISLGTSDTFFAAMPTFKTDPAGCGHVFGNPAGGFMSLICFTNGSLARERVKAECGVDWDFFDRGALAETSFENEGRLMLPYFVPESTPPVQHAQVFTNFTSATPAQRIRALLTSQVLSIRHHAAWMDQSFQRIRLTGGASESQALQQLIANIFQAEVETIQVPNSAALGAAMRAFNAIEGTSFEVLSSRYCHTTQRILPDPTLRTQADALLRDFAAFEAAHR